MSNLIQQALFNGNDGGAVMPPDTQTMNVHINVTLILTARTIYISRYIATLPAALQEMIIQLWSSCLMMVLLLGHMATSFTKATP